MNNFIEIALIIKVVYVKAENLEIIEIQRQPSLVLLWCVSFLSSSLSIVSKECLQAPAPNNS